MPRKTKNIVLGVTASVAIYKACDLLRRLREEGFSVPVVMSLEARELISPVLFESLSGHKVSSGLFSRPEDWQIEHVSLAQQADAVVIAPATANVIAKIAAGICDDLLTCLVAATQAPVLFAPAMNENMYSNKITQENIKKLTTYGYRFIGPRRGKLACGDTGLGCLAQVEEIVKAVKGVV